jgi:uncharacterized membrane protein YccF (DUF307 family)
MSLLGNILWIFLGGGLVLFLEYVIGGLLLCLTVVGIPFGIQCVKLGLLAIAPFGRDAVDTGAPAGFLPTVMNLLWIILGGIWIAITHAAFAILMALTIVGIPFARQHVKLCALSLVPFGKVVR